MSNKRPFLAVHSPLWLMRSLSLMIPPCNGVMAHGVCVIGLRASAFTVKVRELSSSLFARSVLCGSMQDSLNCAGGFLDFVNVGAPIRRIAVGAV